MIKKQNRKISQIDQHIAKKFKEIRTLKGVSQDQLAIACGLSSQQIHKYENATSRITAAKLYEVSQILEIPINFFYEKIKINQKISPYKIVKEKKLNEKSVVMSKELLALNRSFAKIGNKQAKKYLTALINAISGSHYRKKNKHQFS